MKKVIRCSIAAILITLSLIGINFTTSRGTSQLQKDVKISSDTIDIRVIDKTLENMSIVPETIVDTNLYIQNAGAICYIRWKADVTINDVLQRQLSTGDFPELDESWILSKDGYYYLEIPINEYEEHDLFEKLRFTEDLIDPLKEGDQVVITTTVQAIQSEHFTPRWKTDQPWNNQKIEKTVRSRMEVGNDKK